MGRDEDGVGRLRGEEREDEGMWVGMRMRREAEGRGEGRMKGCG